MENYNYFVSHFYAGGGGGNNIYNEECGETKTILFPIFMLGRDNTIYIGPPPGQTFYDM